MGRKRILNIAIGIPSMVGLFLFAGWKVAICIIGLIWAENLKNKRY